MLGGVELRMGREARLLARSGYTPNIAVNLHSGLTEWAHELGRSGIPIVNFDPPPVFEGWLWRRKLPLREASLLKRFKLEYKTWLAVRSINKIRARQVFRKTILKSTPDLIHIFIPWSGFETTRLYLSHIYRLPIILSVRNAFPKFNWSPWDRRHYREAFHSVRGVYAISQSALDLFKDLYSEFIRTKTVLRVIHNSVDTNRFKPDTTKRQATRKKFNIPMDASVVGFVGRIEKQKRPQSVIEAFDKIAKSNKTIYLIMVGSGPLEKIVEQRAIQLGLKDNVIFTGWKSNVEDYIPAFDVALQLSNNEGFGTTTAEIMACGVPVIGTDVPGTRDILEKGRGGILVPLNDELAAAKASLSILQDGNKRMRMAEEARREAVENYQETAWENKILDFYGEINPTFYEKRKNANYGQRA